jgi:hypothetical protein
VIEDGVDPGVRIPAAGGEICPLTRALFEIGVGDRGADRICVRVAVSEDANRLCHADQYARERIVFPVPSLP